MRSPSLLLLSWAISSVVSLPQEDGTAPGETGIHEKQPHVAEDSDIMAQRIWPNWYREFTRYHQPGDGKRPIIISQYANVFDSGNGVSVCRFWVRDIRPSMRARARLGIWRAQIRARGIYYMQCATGQILTTEIRRQQWGVKSITHEVCICRPESPISSQEIQAGATVCIQDVAENDAEAWAYTTIAEVSEQFRLTEAEYLLWSQVSPPDGSQHKSDFVDTIRWPARRGTLYRACARNFAGYPNIRLHVGFQAQTSPSGTT